MTPWVCDTPGYGAQGGVWCTGGYKAGLRRVYEGYEVYEVYGVLVVYEGFSWFMRFKRVIAGFMRVLSGF